MELSTISFEKALRKTLAAGKHEPYLQHIRFPRFKNLTNGTRVDFSYPITAIVGPNGTNKSSILRAIEGAPDQQNIGNHWFTTNLDPINAEERHRFIQGYKTPSGKIVETIKTRVERKGNPDYWEPSRPLTGPSDAMEKMSNIEDVPRQDRHLRRKTRWNPLQKDVVYLDLAFYVSAFDLFYRLDAGNKHRSQAEKKKVLRERTVHLKTAIQTRATSHSYYTRERILETAEELGKEDVEWISKILGRKYNSVKVIKHSYYDSPGYTVALKAGQLEYSEAFAGSGEYAVTFLVNKILNAKLRSLIILDEPELSLHPSAQKELMKFLQIMCLKKYHQVVIATHSPSIVEDLPPDAIKMMTLDEETGQATIPSQSTYAIDAFQRLGVTMDKLQIFVEDELARAIVNAVLFQMGVESSVEVLVLGSSSIIRGQYIPTLSHQNRECLVLLDGDEKPPNDIPPVEEIPSSMAITYLELLVPSKESLGLDGGNHDNQEQHIDVAYRILEWSQSHVKYLPSNTPEELIMECLGLHPLPGQSPKDFWKEQATAKVKNTQAHEADSQQILFHQRSAINDIDLENSLLSEVKTILDEYLHRR